MWLRETRKRLGGRGTTAPAFYTSAVHHARSGPSFQMSVNFIHVTACRVKCLEDTIVDYRRTQVTVETIERQLDRIYTELDELREEGNNLRNGGGVAKLPFAPKANASEESGGVANTETLPLKFKDESPPTTGSVDVAKPEPPLTTDPLPTTDLAGSRGSAKTKAISPAITGDIVAESQAHERNKMLLSNMRKVEVSELMEEDEQTARGE